MMRCHGPRRWLGENLRRLADRIDWYGAPRYTNLTFHFEDGVGLVVDHNTGVSSRNHGCPLMYCGEDDYEKAFSPAPPTRPNPGTRSM